MKHLDRADRNSIRYELQKILQCKDEESESLDIAKFCDTYFPGCSYRHVLKQMRFGRAGLQILSYAIKQDYTVTEPIIVYNANGTGRCKVRLVKDATQFMLVDQSRFIKDISQIINDYAVIYDLESIEEGAGADVIKRVTYTLQGKSTLALARCMYVGDYSSIAYSNELANVQRDIASIFESAGFIDVSSNIGRSERSIAMFHGSNEDLIRIRRHTRGSSISGAAGIMGGGV